MPQRVLKGFVMYPKDLNPYYDYLQQEVRIARAKRDLAISQFLDDAVTRFARIVSKLIAK